jgi:hypothetical protein
MQSDQVLLAVILERRMHACVAPARPLTWTPKSDSLYTGLASTSLVCCESFFLNSCNHTDPHTRSYTSVC